jgi:Protein of unknown function (DUF1552)
MMDRRTFLRGAGAALALPFLDAMGPLTSGLQALAGPGAGDGPTRLLFLFVPNGMHMEDWTPTTEGADYTLPWILEPLAPFKQHVSVLSGLAIDGGRAHGDGPGDHARAAGSFLTCAHPHKTSGADIRVGISVDQVAANAVGAETRFPSLELGTEGGLNAGSCDSGYSCAYSSNVSWRGPSSPCAKETNPRAVFERLFGVDDLSPAERARRQRYRASILDLAREDAHDLRGRLGRADQRKLEEYTDAVRELEQRLERAEDEDASSAAEQMTPPTGTPGDYGEHIRVMHDLTALAFQTDQTRVASFMIGNAGSNRSYRWLDVSEGHHRLSHHGRDAAKQEKIRRINRWHVEQLAYLLGKLQAIDDGGRTLLERTLIVFASGIGDGNRHNHDDLPVLLCGHGNGSVVPGRHLRYPAQTPMADLYLALLDRVGVRRASFADSRGHLPHLDG